MPRPIRILHVQHSLDPGGMENGVVNIARALAPRGFEFHVACLSNSGEFAARLPDPDLVHALAKPDGFSPRTVLRLRKLIRTLQPDLIHSHNLGALIYAACATAFARKPPILHGEHGEPNDGAEQAKRDRQRQRFFKAARRVHTVSQSLLDYFIEAGFPAKKLLALVNGVDTERFSPGNRDRARRELGIPPGAPVLVIVGRLIHSKNHLLLFEALEKLVASHPSAILLVIGGGGQDEAEITAAAASSSAADHIRMEGYRSDPRPYYHAADLLVAPSHIEGLSNVVLEAMACGLPPLLHEACGSDEVIENGVDGLAADLRSVDRLAAEITALLSDPDELKAMGARARESAVERFSLQTMAKAYEDIYRELAGDNA
jgi:glycosyltransferase involved in cell wall biosynthesis